MKIDIEKVRRLFLLYADLPARQGARWDILCRKAAAVLEGRLRKDTDWEKQADRLASSAALWAYGDYLLVEQSASASAGEFRLGDITVKNSAGTSPDKRLDAREMKEYALSEIADLIGNNRFVFLAVGEEHGE